MASLFVSLSGVARTLAISVPTVIEAVRGRVTIERCDARLRAWATSLLDHAEVTRTVLNVEHVPADETFILMSNHKSLYDVPLLIESFPRTLRMVTKTELFRVPIWGPAMREAGFIEIDRKNSARAKEGLEVAKARLAEGINVWIAPEGTRSRSESGAIQEWWVPARDGDRLSHPSGRHPRHRRNPARRRCAREPRGERRARVRHAGRSGAVRKRAAGS
jgi:1-acyl-sn-glycerol-3-phosphate acyltransferase